MRILGEICLLAAFVSVGFAAFACIVGARCRRPGICRAGSIGALMGVGALTAVMAILIWALLVKDFHFNYVAQYSSRLLPWHYSVSALWVGQSGSLLLWAWMLGLLAIFFRFGPSSGLGTLRDPAFGILMGYCLFLVATMVFGADPMEANIAPGGEGAGLSPLLQHPAMLIHPPIVFLGYAVWAVPFALVAATMISSSDDLFPNADCQMKGPNTENQSSYRSVDEAWTERASVAVRLARPWSLTAWTVLGAGILLGAYWSYEELGWGGYWAWDPVENGSLIPWLLGTALIHAQMAWQFRGMLKKTCVALAIATFGMCNFATFLTRSGIFSSLHAFSRSPIGWLFLVLMLLLAVGGVVTILRRRINLVSDNPLAGVWTRESMVLVSIVALLLLVLATVSGTLSVALSEAIVGRRIMVGQAFYNHVLIPIGLLLLAVLAPAPLLRWGASPTKEQIRALTASACAASGFAFAVWMSGVHHPLALAVGWLAALALANFILSLFLEVRRLRTSHRRRGMLQVLAAHRRMYAGFVIHLGFVCIAVGVTGSSLGSKRREVVMGPGQTVEWSGRSIRFERLVERELPDRFIAAAELEVNHGDDAFRLLPAQHFHRLQNQWTTEVAIHSTWRDDFYAILHNSEGGDAVRLTLIENPLMRWMWFGGCVIITGVVLRLWPSRRPLNQTPRPRAPHFLRNSSRARQRNMAAATN